MWIFLKIPTFAILFTDVRSVKKQLKHIISDFMQRMRFKYRVSILNENTLEETWHTRLSRFSVLLFVSAFFLTTFILLTFLIFVTPLRHYLPGYGESGNRITIVQQSMTTDSLMHQLELQQAYLSVLKDIINEKPQNDTIKSLDSIMLRERATVLLEKSKRENDFVKDFEESQKFNISSISARSGEKMYVFFRPVRGVIASKFEPQDGNFGVSVITSSQENVMSVLEGIVIYAAFTFDYGWVIEIQHENGYISIYKNNTRLLKNTGDTVKAGETIAVTGDEQNVNERKHFYFEVWKQGIPLNPQDVIVF
ncbi:MAG: Peptidase [Bacteroidetes bacterium]|nr:Peptidase [Bacteroidota bacterium]